MSSPHMNTHICQVIHGITRLSPLAQRQLCATTCQICADNPAVWGKQQRRLPAKSSASVVGKPSNLPSSLHCSVKYVFQPDVDACPESTEHRPVISQFMRATDHSHTTASHCSTCCICMAYNPMTTIPGQAPTTTASKPPPIRSRHVGPAASVFCVLDYHFPANNTWAHTAPSLTRLDR